MNTLTLKLRNPKQNKCEIFINNERKKVQKNEFGNYVVTYQTDESEINLRIQSVPHELAGKFWILKYLLYFFVSLFGIFDSRYSKDYYSFNYESKVNLSQNTEIDLSFNEKEDNGKALEDKNNVMQDNETNVYIFNPSLKKRRIITLVIKYVSWALLVLGIILSIVFNFT